jgi:hypothetical protein
MIRSPYGKKLYIAWKGFARPDMIVLEVVDSTLEVSDELQEKVKVEWEKILKKNPHNYDGHLWRFEGLVQEWGGPHVYVSPTRYSIHNVLRHEKFPHLSDYPTPFSISSLQETDDGYLLAGVRGKTSDQKGIHVLGAGFVKRYDAIATKEETASLLPEPLINTILRECGEETKYTGGEAINRRRIRAIVIAFGSNHDVTTGVHVPLSATRDEVELGNQEHSDLLFIPNKNRILWGIIKNGDYQSIPVSDQSRAILQAYVQNREQGYILPSFVHK